MPMRPFMAYLLAGRVERERRAMSDEATAKAALYPVRNDSQVMASIPAPGDSGYGTTDIRSTETIEAYVARKRREDS